MGLIPCPDCGNMVSDRAAACPNCGCPADAFYESVPQENEEYYNDSPGILSSVLKTAVGVALGNKISENSKQNYLGSPNCERAKTGRKSSCWGCGLADHCTMYDRY